MNTPVKIRVNEALRESNVELRLLLVQYLREECGLSGTRIGCETSRQVNPLLVEGQVVGEAGTIGATPAIANAVIDALSPLRIRHLDIPFTPERVWRAINEKGGAS